MKFKCQLVVFEVLSGVFGFVWIGSNIAVIVLFGLALFDYGNWWNVFYAATVSIVAKWLMRGFVDNQKRVVFEAHLVSKGMSPKEAGQAWLEAYAGHGKSNTETNQPSDGSRTEDYKRKAEERVRIIADFGEFIERNPPGGGDQIWDVKCLPHAKEAILDAICVEIMREDDEKRIEALKIGALFLANYQEGIGDQPLSMLGVDLTLKDPSSLNDDDLQALATQIDSNPSRDRFDAYKPFVERDAANILAKLFEAENSRRDMLRKSTEH